jgi:hypothetical protein
MSFVVMGIGLLIVLVGLIIVVKPSVLADLLPSLLKGKKLYLVASVRLLAGCAMVLAAPQAHHPLFMEIIGWIAVLAGLLIVVLPPKVMQIITGWVEAFPTWLMRTLSPIVFAFGGYLVWSFL